MPLFDDFLRRILTFKKPSQLGSEITEAQNRERSTVTWFLLFSLYLRHFQIGHRSPPPFVFASLPNFCISSQIQLFSGLAPCGQFFQDICPITPCFHSLSIVLCEINLLFSFSNLWTSFVAQFYLLFCIFSFFCSNFVFIFWIFCRHFVLVLCLCFNM